jgi:myo-inositol-1(or 4)-monophosphatase
MAAATEARDGLLSHDWLGACRRATDGLRAVLAEHPTSRERVTETGTRGEGGDRTLVIDAAAEDAVFAELQRMHDAGARFTAVSEERGEVDFGGAGAFVVVDPIDGSMNAKRGLPHHSLSIAVADGPTMADVVFGYVFDLGPGEEWHATRGAGAYLNGERLADPPPERRRPDGRLELVAVESAHPRWLAASSDALVTVAHRVRAMGSIAVSLCQVAAVRVDGMATLRRCRAVDAAAAQLVVRESGGIVTFTGDGEPLDAPALDAPLDLTPRRAVVAARTDRALAELATLPTF